MLWLISLELVGFFSLGGASMMLMFLGIYFLMDSSVYFVEWEVINMESSSILMTFLFDWMSLMFMSFVLLISSLVIYYSSGYMSGDYNIDRFIILVLMFVLSMMLLIISPNMISILLGWDGLGLVSYCLVIYYQNIKSFNAGMITALSNRIGDVAILLAIAWMLNYGSWNYVFYLDCAKNSLEMEVVGGLVVLASMTKSAQIPFSAWLPAAMAAPTPVSALVHSSTLVTAGVYLLIRFSSVVSELFVSDYLLLLAGLTMFMAGMGANFEYDLKKIIALSTLSQLGLMVSILALGLPHLAFFHLLMHALFKALLFKCAGAVIHNAGGSQDIRHMGGLIGMMPYTSSCFMVSNLALGGMPFLAGFYSKDLILEEVSLSLVNCIKLFFVFFSTGLTVCYSLRLVYYTMGVFFNCFSSHSINDNDWSMSAGMLGLLVASVIGGSTMSWLIFPSPAVIVLPLYLKMLTMAVMVAGASAGTFFGELSIGNNYLFKNYYKFAVISGSMWYMPFISGLSGYYPLSAGSSFIVSMDQGWSEYLGGQGLYNSMSLMSKFVQWWQNNDLKLYLLSFLLWLFILTLY
uniref:NADH-ubiquinone oxidoreductase chain 5 n=1 Tax=Atelura formicaria TaxID=459531 RepID=B5KME0_9INSE|nr:NADH dehydrogenase subunit 5 [Atelura formicaria]ABS88983.1 NADH dehydrogenase subunit 5 [Atelura formicaria]